MSTLSLNIQDGFRLAYYTSTPYRAYTVNDLVGSRVSNSLRVIASGGVPPYGYNLLGNVDGTKFALHNFTGNGQREAYADVGIAKSRMFGKNDVGDTPVVIRCTDLTGATVSVSGTLSVVDSPVPYTLTYKLYSENPSCFANMAYFKTGLMGLTVAPRGFYVFKNLDKFSMGLRVYGQPNGKVIISQVKKPFWVEFTQPDLKDPFYKWAGIVQSDVPYDQLYPWEITIIDYISASNQLEYPSIPVYVCVRAN